MVSAVSATIPTPPWARAEPGRAEMSARSGRRVFRAAALIAGFMLSACVSGAPPGAGLQATRPTDPAASGPAAPSARSAALARHYEKLQAHLLAQGLLRTDGGGADTPFGPDDLARNFERIAFYDEYARGGGLTAASEEPQPLRRWVRPVRMRVEFGASVPASVRSRDKAAVTDYAARLSRLTGHPISVSDRAANFTVLIASEDDRAETLARVRELAPEIGAATIALLRNPPRSIYCMVLTFADKEQPNTYSKAIALIRSEQPDLMRLSCIHEELAQGLGLGNDSATARPSIFNDDEEFALLTSHDEALLRLLYHPALKPGMTLEQARPLIRRILAGDSGQI